MKRCRTCRKKFTPTHSSLQACCSTDCALTYARLSAGTRQQSVAQKRMAAAEKRERRNDIKSRKDWLREAQAVFNAMIRERDHFKPCISCGIYIANYVNGGAWDAGHFRSVGAAPELRFEPLNCHKQCKDCNSNTRRGGKYSMPVERAIGIRTRYRENLVDRIGLAQVERLESYHEPLKPSVEWLREKIVEWRRETRQMRESRERRAVA